MGRERKDKLEDLRASNEQLREENESLKAQVNMFNQEDGRDGEAHGYFYQIVSIVQEEV
jgi:cell division protein FtsB